MVNVYKLSVLALLTVGLLALTACSGGGASPAAGPASNGMMNSLASGSAVVTDTDTLVNDTDEDDNDSDLRRLDDIRTIGSTIDPDNGDQNPYGLDVAKSTAGKIVQGDLVVCNFNNAANVQGTGKTIIALHPVVGAHPRHIAESGALLGCTALALSPGDNPWAAAFAANDNPIFGPDGTLLTTLAGGPWHGPFGQTFSSHGGPFGVAAFYESNAADGSIVRINIHASGPFTFDVIARGFAVNHGVPGSILGPSGLQYDKEHDRLYIVDGANNTVVALRHVSTIPAGGITVSGTTFSGPFRHRARLVFAGAPLNGPISSALLPDGHLVIGNTLDPTGKNLMVEITPRGHLLAVKNVDRGNAGALFGMVATGNEGDRDNTRIWFNDDNDNTVKLLTP